MEKKVIFNSFDGTKLVGIFEGPLDGTKGVVLLVHGIPSEKNEWGFYSDMAAELKENGYASFRFDFRCNGESDGGDLKNLTISSMVNDIEAAYLEIRKYTSAPLYLVGTSCGGGVAIKWLYDYARKVEHVFLMAPVLNYRYEVFGGKEQLDVTQIRWLQKDGVVGEEIPYGIAMVNEAMLFNADFYLQSVPNTITIFHGDSDTVVPYDFSLDAYKKYRSKVDMVTIEGADHGFAVPQDDDLTHPDTKKNHRFVYRKMIERIQ